MKKFILKIILFFCIVVVVDLGVGAVGGYLQAHAKGGRTRTLNDFVMKDKHDVIVFGSSRAHHHYDTPFLSDTLGLDVYNAGYDGNGVVLAYGLLEMILDRYKPKMIVYDVAPSFDVYLHAADNNHRRYIEYLKPYYKVDEVGKVIKEVSVMDWYMVHSGMYCYNTSITGKFIENLRNIPMKKKGYDPMFGVYKGNANDIDDGIEVIDPFKLMYIRKFIHLTKKEGIPLVIVASPSYGRTSSERNQPVFDICAAEGVECLDYYADSTFMHHKEWFKDSSHLNSVGARMFSKIIAEEIKSRIKE